MVSIDFFFLLVFFFCQVCCWRSLEKEETVAFLGCFIEDVLADFERKGDEEGEKKKKKEIAKLGLKEKSLGSRFCSGPCLPSSADVSETQR